MPLSKDLYREEWARRIEVNDDEYALSATLRIGYCYCTYNEWNKTNESIFQNSDYKRPEKWRYGGKDKTSLHCATAADI